MKANRRLCRERFTGYMVAIDRRHDPGRLGPFFASGDLNSNRLGHRAFFWKHAQARTFRRDLAEHGFKARIVPVSVQIAETLRRGERGAPTR